MLSFRKIKKAKVIVARMYQVVLICCRVSIKISLVATVTGCSHLQKMVIYTQYRLGGKSFTLYPTREAVCYRPSRGAAGSRNCACSKLPPETDEA